MVNETLLWDAVSSRDAHWDGVFVYAVPSTRVYCRPTCPSRRPRREGVAFFATTAAAQSGWSTGHRPSGPANWFHARLPDQFDGVVHFDRTTAVEPVERTSLWDEGEPPETFRTGL